MLLVLLIWAFYPNASTCKDLHIYKKAMLSNVSRLAQPGDLLLFSSNRYNIITRTFGHDTFSHIAIVLPDRTIFEMVENDYMKPNTEAKKGIVISSFEERIKNYNGNVYIAALTNPLTDTQLQSLRLYTTKTFRFPTRLRALFRLLGTKMPKDTRFCSELIADVLNYIGVSNVPSRSRKYALHKALVGLCDDDVYHKPVHIIPDDLMIDTIKQANNIISYC